MSGDRSFTTASTRVLLSTLGIYRKLTFDKLKLCYRFKYVDYSAHGYLCPSRFEKYGFEYDRDMGGPWMAYKGKDGEKALVICVSVPTFDSGDREWDSYRKLFLLPGRSGMSGYMVCGGYNIAKVIAYKGVFCADKKTKELLDEAAKKL